MDLSKPMITVFRSIIHGNHTIDSLKLNKSFSWTASVISDLEKEGFITKKPNFSIKASRKAIEISGNNYTLKLRDLIIKYPTIKFEQILADSKLKFLATLEDWITLKEASKLSKVSTHMILRYKKKLENRGIIEKKGKLYRLNKKSWPLLNEFIIEYKNHSTLNGYIKWKYEDEIIFEVDQKKLIKGEITGLSKFKDYGINVRTISALCVLPERKLTKEEIFIHSLFESDDYRNISLILTFYLKNKLKEKRVLPIAMKYGKYSQFNNLINFLKGETIPMFDREDFIRIAKMYGVKNV